MLQAFDLSYSPNPSLDPLFQHLNLSLDPGEVAVLMGRNGVGKTKLFEILAGRLVPDGGRVEHDDLIAYLPQDLDLTFEGTLADDLVHDDGDPAETGRLARVASRLGISRAQLDQPYPSLCIGERMRAAIARLLLDDPTVLLLDEPTNNLDREAKAWLERFLSTTPLAVLMVCHDRALVDAVADRVLELTPTGLREFAGGYSAMTEAKETAHRAQSEAYVRQGKEDRRLKAAAASVHETAKDVVRRPTQRTYSAASKPFYEAKRAKLDKRAKAIAHRAAQLSAGHVAKPFEEPPMRVAFRSRPLRHADALNVRGLVKRYGDRTLFDGFDLTLLAGERVALLGPNGAGKTTLFRLLLGEESPDAGTVVWSPDARPSSLSQARSALPLDATVPEALASETREDEQFARNLLGTLRMRGDAVAKPLSVLSVGERTKVELVAILMTPCNVLLLDEPTNHLDVDSLEALEEALLAFEGSVLFTSHDPAFIARLAHRTVELHREAGTTG